MPSILQAPTCGENHSQACWNSQSQILIASMRTHSVGIRDTCAWAILKHKRVHSVANLSGNLRVLFEGGVDCGRSYQLTHFSVNQVPGPLHVIPLVFVILSLIEPTTALIRGHTHTEDILGTDKTPWARTSTVIAKCCQQHPINKQDKSDLFL